MTDIRQQLEQREFEILLREPARIALAAQIQVVGLQVLGGFGAELDASTGDGRVSVST